MSVWCDFQKEETKKTCAWTRKGRHWTQTPSSFSYISHRDPENSLRAEIYSDTLQVAMKRKRWHDFLPCVSALANTVKDQWGVLIQAEASPVCSSPGGCNQRLMQFARLLQRCLPTKKQQVDAGFLIARLPTNNQHLDPFPLTRTSWVWTMVQQWSVYFLIVIIIYPGAIMRRCACDNQLVI